MDIKEQLSPEQLRVVFNAPLAAATYVAAASGGGFDMIKELTSASKFIAEQAQKGAASGYGAVVDSLLALMRSMSREDAKAQQLPYEKSKDPAAMRSQLRQTVADGWAAVVSLPEADGFARWVLDVSRAAALAKTGGHFGIGNRSEIDAQEQAALDDLAAVMAPPQA